MGEWLGQICVGGKVGGGGIPCVFPIRLQIFPVPIYDLFVCGISLTSGQLVIELIPDCTRSDMLLASSFTPQGRDL